ncbi:MAG: protein translocase SEC61 complex subunit gamma [Candidatus Aenigmatarchaeota archaeon]
MSKIVEKIKNLIESYKRVLTIAKKPDKEDLYETLKVCLIVMLIVGFIGFIFYSISILFIG